MNYTLEISIGDTLESIIHSSGVHVVEIHYQPYIRITDGATPESIYASNVLWTVSKTLEAKIIEMDTAIASKEDEGVLVDVGDKSANYNISIPANSHFKYIKTKKVSGNPTIGVTLAGEDVIIPHELTSREYIPMDYPVDTATDYLFTVSGGTVSLKYKYIPNDWPL